MMATQSPVTPDLLGPNSRTTTAAIKTMDALKSNAPKQDSASSLRKDLEQVASENREPVPATSSSGATKIVAKGGKNALLARVQAAQERARAAQEAKKKAMAELEKARLEEERILKGLEDEMKEEGIQEEEEKGGETSNVEAAPNSDLFEALNTSEHLQASLSAPATVSPDTTSVPAVAPPSENDVPPPPSHEEVDEDFSAYAFDSDGNKMSKEDKQRMLEEQQEILRKIQIEKEANDRVIAALTYGDVIPDDHAAANDSATAATSEAAPSSSGTVEIAPNKRVALHGRGRTEAAIADGTAVLVQCVNCQNWMQVTPSATLMFCPVCQVVSPVQHQSSVHTTEDAVRLSLDRKMAEKLQQQIWDEEREEDEEEQEAEESGMFEKLKSSLWGEGAVVEQGRSVDAETEQSWGQYLSSLVSSEESKPVPNQGSAEITVSKRPAVPSGRSAPKAKPVRTRLYDNENADEDNAENSSLLPGRVAETKPLFSCLAEQVSNMIVGAPEPPEEVHGVDSSSLLAVPDIRRDKDGSGAYASLGSEDAL